jgi:hypothetical protein
MTALADAKAIAPTANAKLVVSAKGTDINGVMLLIQQHCIELQTLVKYAISVHPSGGADAANPTALNALLAELL